MKASSYIQFALAASFLVGCAPQTAPVSEAEPFTYTLTPLVLIEGEPLSQASLADRLAQIGVPNASALVMVEGEVVHEDYIGDKASEDALYQSASLSKAVAALGIALFAKEQGIDLDEDIRPYMKSLSISDLEGGDRPISLRELLSHTAGANVHGFPGYADGDTIPTTQGVILGEGNTDAVAFTSEPGLYDYSGGGYTVAQLFAEDVSGEPFPALMERLVLKPLQMTGSTFDFPLSAQDWPSPVMTAHNASAPVEGGWYHYPESAAAGLWTTARDYARFADALMMALNGDADGPIPQDIAREMVKPVDNGYGLGLSVVLEDDRLTRFRHSGANNGYRSEFIAVPDRRAVAVILTNHDRGSWVNGEFLRGAVIAMGETAHDQVTVTRRPITPEITARCDGDYSVSGRGDAEFELALDDGNAVLVEQGSRLDLIHTGDGSFIYAPRNLEFVCSAEGEATRISVRDESYLRIDR